MERVKYGNTDLEVSKLCFGAGHLANVCKSYEEGGKLLLEALERGVTFWDTAEMYQTQPHLGAALKHIPRSQVVIQTKTTAKDKAGAQASIEKALRELGTDYLDIILLHALSSPEDFESRQGALEAMLEAKTKGIAKVVGCSTHVYTGPILETVIVHPNIEVILSTANKGGTVLEGDMKSHLELLKKAFQANKGVSIMKVVAGGKAANEAEDWVKWGFEFPWAHAVNLGLCNIPELELDVKVANQTARRKITKLAA